MGSCSEEQFLAWASDAVQLVASKLETEPFRGRLDICTVGCSCSSGGTCSSNPCGQKCITLPREVGTVLAVNICGRPALAQGEEFEFHLNSSGSGCGASCEFNWADQGLRHYTFRDIITPANLVVHLQSAEDNGKKVIVYGYDSNGNVLRRTESGTHLNGILLPTIFGYAIPDAGQPLIARITGIAKDPTAGTVRIATTDSSGATGINLSIMEPDETLPQLRRIKISRSSSWVRILYRKSNPTFTSRYDHVPMHSRLAFLLALQARKSYRDMQIAEAMQYESNAARLELENQISAEPPVYSPIQVYDRSQSLIDKSDYDIV